MKRLRLHPSIRQHPMPWLTMGIGCALLIILWLLRGVLTPFAIGAILAYMFNPLYKRLAHHCSSSLAAAGSVAALLLLMAVGALIILPLFISQLLELIARLPDGVDWFNDQITPWLAEHWGLRVSVDSLAVHSWIHQNAQTLEHALNRALPTMAAGGLAVLNLLAGLVLLPVILFYLLRDGEAILKHSQLWLPPGLRERALPVLHDVDQALSAYLRGQLSVMLMMSAYYVSALLVTGLEYALPVGLITGMLICLPYLGMATGLTLATLCAWLQFGASWHVLVVWAVFAGGQMLEGFVITPKLVGKAVGLHPLVIIFALLAFGKLLGFIGVLLAIPLAATLMVGARHLQPRYQQSRFYRM